MAATMDDDDDEPGGGSPMTAIVFLVVAALTAAAAGFGAGKVLFAPLVPASMAVDAAKAENGGSGDDPAGVDAKAKGKDGQAHAAGDLQVALDDPGRLRIVDLDPVTTNLSAPSRTWVRAEFSLGIDGDTDEAVIEQIQSDIVAYMRTVRLQSVSRPSGFQHLLADLQDRAALRSDGAVKRVFVKALLFE